MRDVPRRSVAAKRKPPFATARQSGCWALSSKPPRDRSPPSPCPLGSGLTSSGNSRIREHDDDPGHSGRQCVAVQAARNAVVPTHIPSHVTSRVTTRRLPIEIAPASQAPCVPFETNLGERPTTVYTPGGSGSSKRPLTGTTTEYFWPLRFVAVTRPGTAPPLDGRISPTDIRNVPRTVPSGGGSELEHALNTMLATATSNADTGSARVLISLDLTHRADNWFVSHRASSIAGLAGFRGKVGAVLGKMPRTALRAMAESFPDLGVFFCHGGNLLSDQMSRRLKVWGEFDALAEVPVPSVTLRHRPRVSALGAPTHSGSTVPMPPACPIHAATAYPYAWRWITS